MFSLSIFPFVRSCLSFSDLSYSGVRNAAQRKLLDELGIPAKDLPVDQFVPLGRMLYKAPSDGKWGEHERKFLLKGPSREQLLDILLLCPK